MVRREQSRLATFDFGRASLTGQSLLVGRVSWEAVLKCKEV